MALIDKYIAVRNIQITATMISFENSGYLVPTRSEQHSYG